MVPSRPQWLPMNPRSLSQLPSRSSPPPFRSDLHHRVQVVVVTSAVVVVTFSALVPTLPRAALPCACLAPGTLHPCP